MNTQPTADDGPQATDQRQLYILYIDRYHLDDSLFLQALARMLAVAGLSRPACLLVHGSGEQAERRLEGEGFDVKREGRVLVAGTAAEQAIVERAVRESNQRLVSVLTNSVVHAVGLQGADRGLVQVHEDGAIGVGKVGWIRDLAQKRAVPVISASSRIRETGAVVEADAAEVAVRLAETCGRDEATVVFFTKGGKPGIPQGEGTAEEAGLSALEGTDLLPDLDALVYAVEAGVRVLLSGVPGFMTARGAAGTQIVT
ncbi:MAG TPA: hypothetical protein VFG50_14395 [Rhodothermales bacterium]|nr:hypothetical protein [Rhodothermales bacterium]